MSDLIPRLSAAEMAPELAQMLRPRIERLGYLGEFFQCTAHQPQALISFLKLTEDLKQALPDKLTEIVALTVASVTRNSYERVQHERLSLKLGFGKSWLQEVISLEPGSSRELTDEEVLAQKLVLAVVARQGHVTDAEFGALVDAIGHKQAIAVLMLVGRYMMHAVIANTLGLRPPVASPLDEK